MDIIKEIKEEINIFTSTTGRLPTVLYLGGDEAALLAQWAYNSGYAPSVGYPMKTWVGNRRPELFGMNIYVVNEDRHLACG